MLDIPTFLADDQAVKLAIIFGTGAAVFVIGYGLYVIQNTMETRQRERTRREIAAYVAEGTIAPEDAAVLLGLSPKVEASLADAIESGNLSAEDVERVVRSTIAGARAGAKA